MKLNMFNFFFFMVGLLCLDVGAATDLLTTAGDLLVQSTRNGDQVQNKSAESFDESSHALNRAFGPEPRAIGVALGTAGHKPWGGELVDFFLFF